MNVQFVPADGRHPLPSGVDAAVEADTSHIDVATIPDQRFSERADAAGAALSYVLSQPPLPAQDPEQQD